MSTGKLPIGRLASISMMAALAVAGIGAGLVVAPRPALAQFVGAGYRFLEAVRKKDGEEVDKALGATPGLVNTRDVTTGETPLHIVTQRRDVTWLAFLLAKGANPNARSYKGVSPLGLAVNLDWADGVETLLSRGARPNDPIGMTGETPLIAAVHQRSVELVRLLVRAGADPLRADNSGRNARDYAELQGKDSPVWEVIDTAAKAAAARRKQSYGPSF